MIACLTPLKLTNILKLQQIPLIHVKECFPLCLRSYGCMLPPHLPMFYVTSGEGTKTSPLP